MTPLTCGTIAPVADVADDNIALFEYHDEPTAPSWKLKNKVGDKEMRKRFLEAQKIVDDLLTKKEKARK